MFWPAHCKLSSNSICTCECSCLCLLVFVCFCVFGFVSASVCVCVFVCVFARLAVYVLILIHAGLVVSSPNTNANIIITCSVAVFASYKSYRRVIGCVSSYNRGPCRSVSGYNLAIQLLVQACIRYSTTYYSCVIYDELVVWRHVVVYYL